MTALCADKLSQSPIHPALVCDIVTQIEWATLN